MGTVVEVKSRKKKQELKPGDWMCISCGAHNYKGKTKCYKCKLSPSSGKAGGNMDFLVTQLKEATQEISNLKAELAREKNESKILGLKMGTVIKNAHDANLAKEEMRKQRDEALAEVKRLHQLLSAQSRAEAPRGRDTGRATRFRGRGRRARRSRGLRPVPR